MARPAYETLYEKIRREIVSGDYPCGSRLPGKRALAERSGVSVITAAHALELLAEEGYIESRERSGNYVIYSPTDRFRAQEAVLDPPVLPDAPVSAEVDGFPFSVLARTMRRVLTEQEGNILQKTPGQGALFFRQALSRYLARSQGIHADPDQIVIGAGAEYLYGLIVDVLGRDRAWAIEYPSYEKIEQVYTARGITPERLPLTREGLRSDALWNCDASVLHVSPYRSYPTGVTASASRRAEYLRWAEEKNRLLIEDDFESEFSIQRKPMDPLFVLSARENVIYLNTFSRTLSPAFRVGYMVLPKRLVPLYRERAGFYSCTVPAFEQYVLTELINSGDFERHIRRVRRSLRAAAGD